MALLARSGSLTDAVLSSARRPPSAIAVSDGDRQLTYEQLREHVVTVADRTRDWRHDGDDVIGVYGAPSWELVVAILGVLHAGAAYLPLDPDLPAARLEFMAKDSGCRHILGDASLQPMLGTSVTVHPLTGGAPDPVGRRHQRNTSSVAGGLAYIIYTSGSTGTPKGVMVGHEHMLRLLDATHDMFELRQTDAWTLCHAHTFDFSVWEIFAALTSGARLVVVPPLVRRSPSDLLALIEAQRVTVLNQTPSAFRLLSQEFARAGRLPASLRLVILGGEAVRPADLRPWFHLIDGESPRLVNMYGITETTVHVTAKTLTKSDCASTGSPIGRALPHLSVHLLDERFTPVPDGVEGEMYVSGPGVAFGYADRPALTAARFVPDPFGPPGSRMYRSGDRARPHPDGGLDYRGRSDGQVKVAGHRIELGEIEAALNDLPPVADAAVAPVTDADGSARLIAFVVPTHGALDPGALRAGLSRTLPAYAIPAAYVEVSRLPLTANGKIDRAALAASQEPARVAHSAFAAPADGRQHELATIWSTVLGVTDVGVDDDFFALGGDSLRLISVVAAARSRGIPIEVEDVFIARTIRAIDRTLDGRPSAPAPPSDRHANIAAGTDRESIEDAFPATAGQQGIIFQSELAADIAAYRDFAGFIVEDRYDPVAFRSALDALSARHPALRTSFDLAARAGPLQLIHRMATTPLDEEHLGEVPRSTLMARVESWRRQQRADPPDVATAPLLRLCVVASSGEFAVDIAMHHSILDGWSVALYIDELVRTYANLRDGRRSGERRGEPSLSMRTAVEQEASALESAAAKQYWTGVAEQIRSTPHTVARPQSGDGLRATYRSAAVPPDMARQLGRSADRLRVPMRTLMLSVHLWSVAAITGWERPVSGVVLTTRPAVEGGADALGVFVNLVPFPIGLPDTLDALVGGVLQLEQQQLPFRHYPLAAIQQLVGQPPFDIVFNYTDFHLLTPFTDGTAGVTVSGWRYWDRTQYAFTVEIGRTPDQGLQVELKRHPETALPFDLIDFERVIMRNLAEVASTPDDGRPIWLGRRLNA